MKFDQNPLFGSRDRMHTNFFWSKFYSFYSVVNLEIRSRSPNSNQIFKQPNVTTDEVWPESVIWFKRQGADKLFGQNLKISKCWCDLEN